MYCRLYGPAKARKPAGRGTGHHQHGVLLTMACYDKARMAQYEHAGFVICNQAWYSHACQAQTWQSTPGKAVRPIRLALMRSALYLSVGAAVVQCLAAGVQWHTWQPALLELQESCAWQLGAGACMALMAAGACLAASAAGAAGVLSLSVIAASIVRLAL